MKITKEYLDDLIVKSTEQSGEIFELYIDFENTNIDITNVVDSEGTTNQQLSRYKEIINYYFTLISNTSDFFSDVEAEAGKSIIFFKSIKIKFIDDKIEIGIETSTEETKSVLEDYFTRYYEEFAPEAYVEIYNFDVIGG